MKEFPESSEIIQRQLLLTNVNNKQLDEECPVAKKIWQFRSEKGYILNISTDFLVISSNLHKTYNNPQGEHKFRDIIELSVNSFLELVPIQEIKRIGLRYVDKVLLESL